MQRFKPVPILIFLFLPVLNGIAVSGDPGHLDRSEWRIDRQLVFTEKGHPNNVYLALLIRELESDHGVGSAVSRPEFESLIERAAPLGIYADKLILYATPKSRRIQNNAHKRNLRVLLQKHKQAEGVRFMQKHRRLLLHAEGLYGVASQDIVSILMWETRLGNYTGHYRIFNVFMAQILHIESAQKYAVQKMVQNGEQNPLLNAVRRENEEKRLHKIKQRAVKNLVALLRYCKQFGIDPLSLRGSWGGALGYTQFMPYRLNYAVDGDNDGKIDLYTWPDAIFSVARYLREFGKYGRGYDARKEGIFSYNHSASYVKGVIAYADAIWKRYKSSL